MAQQQRKKQKTTKEVDETPVQWQTPFSTIENLELSVQSLTASNNTLQSTLNMLDSITKDFTRQCSFTKHDRMYEIVTESDIRNAQLEILRDLRPEMNKLLEEAEQLLADLSVQEAETKRRLDEKQQALSHFRAAVKFASSQTGVLSQSKASSTTTSANINNNNNNNNKSRISSNNNSKSKKSSFLDQLLMKQRQLKKLININELKSLQTEILEMENEMESVDAATGAPVLIFDKEKHKSELAEQLAKLKRQSSQKKREYEEKQDAEATKSVQQPSTHISSSAPARQWTTSESIQKYTNHLYLVQTVLGVMSQPDFVTSLNAVQKCETQCKRYLQALQNEKHQSKPMPTSSLLPTLIQQLKTVCKATMPGYMLGKTAGRVLELMLTQSPLDLQQLLQEFPTAKEKRHNLTKAVLILLQAHIIDISGTDLYIIQQQ
ncbi:MAG: hypothetical protein EXX96DRAFT_543828 [Benjaminiella poitrasii]|nr:MAG: hypothetical protein EXX96DRAFT_543828 [Benjaminiella poitrasii]